MALINDDELRNASVLVFANKQVSDLLATNPTALPPPIAFQTPSCPLLALSLSLPNSALAVNPHLRL